MTEAQASDACNLEHLTSPHLRDFCASATALGTMGLGPERRPGNELLRTAKSTYILTLEFSIILNC